MSLTILDGATVSATGGTGKTYTTDGTSVTGGIHLADASVADFRVRPNITAKVKMPTLQADGSYTKMKVSAVHVVPQILASGKTVFNLVRTELEVHPELSAAACVELRNKGAQLLIDAETTNFWSAGSLTALY
jgi:hypothetical protein